MNDFEIIDFGDEFVEDNNLVDKIDSVSEEEDSDDDIELEDEEDSIGINSDLVDDDNIDELELTDEEKEAIKDKKKKAEVKENSDEESDEESDDSEESDELDPLKVFALELKQKNLIDIPEDWDGDEEALFEAYNKTTEDKAIQLVKEKYQVDNPKVDAVLNYIANGGNIDNYINLQSELSWVEADINDEDTASALVKTYLISVKNLDEEEATELVEGYVEKNKLFPQAEKIQTELKKLKETKEQQLIEAQEDYARREREYFMDTTNKIKSIIVTGKSGGTVIAKNKKADFENFIFTPSPIKNEKGEVVGQMSGFKKTLNEYLNNPDKFVELAYKLYEGLSDTSSKVEAESKAKSNLAAALRKRVDKPPVSKIEFLN
jgi:Holliday junction resolvasome RuvABC endonuclease subunit